MKKKLLILVLLISSFARAQNAEVSLIGTYFWKHAIVLTPCEIDGTLIKGATEITSIPNQYFRIIRELAADHYVIEVLEYTSSKKNFAQYNLAGGTAKFESLGEPKEYKEMVYDKAYFLVSESDVQNHAGQWIPLRFAFGIINFPFKYRMQPGRGDFSGSFNFGAGLGIKLPHKDNANTTFSFLNGYSLSSVDLNAASVRRNATELEQANNFTALSVSFGFLVENRRVQAGMFLGFDTINHLNQKQFGWYYQGKPWLSVGFGYALFSNEEPGGANVKTSQ